MCRRGILRGRDLRGYCRQHCDDPAPAWLVRRFAHFVRLLILSPPLATFPVFHYLHKKHAALVPRLTAVLQQMQKDKTIDALQKAVMVEQ